MAETEHESTQCNRPFPTLRLWWEAYLIARKIESKDDATRSRAVDRLRQSERRCPDLIRILLQFDRVNWRASRVASLLVVLFCIIELLRHYRLGVPLKGDEFMMDWLFLIITPVIFLFAVPQITKAHRRMLEALSDSDDPRVIDAILDIASMDRFGKAGLDVACGALHRLRSHDISSLDDPLRRKLYKLIESKNPALAEVAISAASRLGDTGAIPHVRAVAEGRRAGRKFESVRREAQACLDKLEGLAQNEKEVALLLRPVSDAPANGSALLRPAAENETDKSLLLRPTDRAQH